MKKYNFKDWITKAGIRALKTFAQSCVSLIPAGIMITDVNWGVILGSAALAAILSLLTSIAGLPELEGVDDNGVSD